MGWMGPVPLAMFLDTYDSFAHDNFKINCEQTKKKEIRYNKIINGSKIISFYYVRMYIRDNF